MRKTQWKAHTQQSCRAQHAKEIQDAVDSQKPTLVRSQVPAEQLPKLCREERHKTDNSTSTLFPGASSNTWAPTVLNHHFSTKSTRKNHWKYPLMGDFSQHFPLPKSTTLLLGPEKISTAQVFHFHLFHEGKKENKHEDGTNSHPRGTKSPATSTPTSTRWVSTSQNLSLPTPVLPKGGRLPLNHICRKPGFAQAPLPWVLVSLETQVSLEQQPA